MLVLIPLPPEVFVFVYTHLFKLYWLTHRQSFLVKLSSFDLPNSTGELSLLFEGPCLQALGSTGRTACPRQRLDHSGPRARNSQITRTAPFLYPSMRFISGGLGAFPVSSIRIFVCKQIKYVKPPAFFKQSGYKGSALMARQCGVKRLWFASKLR